MNISSLNKLGLAPQAPKSQGSKASSKDTKSFEGVLGQIQARKDDGKEAKNEDPKSELKRDTKPDVKSDGKAQSQAKPDTQAQTRSQAQGQPAAQDWDSQALPTQPSSPILENPSLNDRILASPNELPVVNPLAKSSVGIVKSEDSGVDSLTRRAVWSDFLRKMKDELGVSAEDVLGAFDSLSAEDLAKPPAETVDKVVMALGLAPQQVPVAKQFFMELIHRTKPKSMGEELATSEKQISLTLMSQRELDRKSQNKAIDNLNQNFFMKGPFERPVAQPVAQAQTPVQSTDEDQPPQTAPIPFIPSNDPATRADQIRAQQAQAMAANGKALPKELQPNNVKPQKAEVDSLLKKFTEGQGQSQQLAQATQVAVPAQAAASAAPVAEAASVASKANESAMAAMQAIFGKGGSESAQDDSDASDTQDFTRDASFLGATAGAEGHRLQNGQASEFQQQLNNVGPNQQPMAVPDLVKNAQVMVTDGGGEMKVTLTPDGLGEVAMKVSVKDGKVNVQMITESDEAKRLIERSLGDLKTQLTHNNLQVSDIKIDTASNLGKQLEQQYQDAQRQATQQSMEQFRQDTQGWRRSFFEVPGAKAYKGQADAPRDVTAPTSVAGAKRASGSRRLDLVA